MARSQMDVVITQSLLDRLTDPAKDRDEEQRLLDLERRIRELTAAKRDDEAKRLQAEHDALRQLLDLEHAMRDRNAKRSPEQERALRAEHEILRNRYESTYAIGLFSRTGSINRYKEGVKRDLVWLLNTRQIPDLPPDGLENLAKSLYCYGLPDIAAMGLHSASDRDRLLRALEATVRKFEPRIAGPKVTLEIQPENVRQLRFRIEGMLRMDPAPEPVVFNTVLELSSGEYEVK